jgi:hypothetical protein
MKTYPKKQKKAYQPPFKSDGSINELSSQYAQPTERQKEQLTVTSDTPASWMNADGTKNYEKYNDFLDERNRAAMNSKSW